jgi:hypothetical protein
MEGGCPISIFDLPFSIVSFKIVLNRKACDNTISAFGCKTTNELA